MLPDSELDRLLADILPPLTTLIGHLGPESVCGRQLIASMTVIQHLANDIALPAMVSMDSVTTSEAVTELSAPVRDHSPTLRRLHRSAVDAIHHRLVNASWSSRPSVVVVALLIRSYRLLVKLFPDPTPDHRGLLSEIDSLLSGDLEGRLNRWLAVRMTDFRARTRESHRDLPEQSDLDRREQIDRFRTDCATEFVNRLLLQPSGKVWLLETGELRAAEQLFDLDHSLRLFIAGKEERGIADIAVNASTVRRPTLSVGGLKKMTTAAKKLRDSQLSGLMIGPHGFDARTLLAELLERRVFAHGAVVLLTQPPIDELPDLRSQFWTAGYTLIDEKMLTGPTGCSAIILRVAYEPVTAATQLAPLPRPPTVVFESPTDRGNAFYARLPPPLSPSPFPLGQWSPFSGLDSSIGSPPPLSPHRGATADQSSDPGRSSDRSQVWDGEEPPASDPFGRTTKALRIS